MLVSLVTPTGGRPEAFKLCESYIRRQTYKGAIQWIVVDDCNPHTVCTLGQEYVRGPMAWQEGINTQRYNLNTALEKVKGDIIAFIEDDDWYNPHYLSSVIRILSNSSVSCIGEGNAKYYHVGSQGYHEQRNVKHCSLCQTVIHKDLLPCMFEAVNSGELYFDIVFWNKLSEKGVPRLVLFDSNLAVGIKGMPGRGGIGVGHRYKGFAHDLEHAKLISWVGERDALPYMQYSKLKSSQKLKEI